MISGGGTGVAWARCETMRAQLWPIVCICMRILWQINYNIIIHLQTHDKLYLITQLKIIKNTNDWSDYSILLFDFQLILKHSMYYPFVKDWMKVFSREQFIVVRSEDFYANHTEVSNRIFSFLELGMITYGHTICPNILVIEWKIGEWWK